MKKIRLILSLLIASLALLPSVAAAKGETYYWQDAGRQAIVGTGGDYKSNATFSVEPGSSPAKFQTQADCGQSQAEVTITADPNSTDEPVKAHLAASCSSATYDTDIAIAKDQASAQPSSVTPASAQTTQNSKGCDQGLLSWVLCPILDRIESAISHLVSAVLKPLLQVNQITPQNTPALYAAWKNIRTLANSLFVLIFLVVIFANTTSFGLDQYTIKKLLPRLVAAAILVQFSFLICSFMVDIGNILGGGVQSLIFGVSGSINSAPANASTAAGNVLLVGLSGAALFTLLVATGPMIIIVAAMLFISLFFFFLTIAARLLLIAILIAISPLAFVAWVLPNTEGYFKKWWSFFFRLLLMYPIIMAILAFTGRLSELLAFTGNTATNGASGLALDLVKPFIYIVAFTWIPWTFKWAGSWMNSFHERFNNLSKASRGKVRASDWYKDKNNERRSLQFDKMNRLANRTAVRKLTHSNSRAARTLGGGLLGTAGLVRGGAPSTSLALARLQGANTNTYTKELEDLPEAQIPTLQDAMKAYYDDDPAERASAAARLQQNAPTLLRYMNDSAGRLAIIKRLAADSMVNRSIMEGIRMRNSGEYGAALRAAGASFSKKPALLARWGEGELEEIELPDGTKQLIPHKAGDVRADALKGILGGLTAAKIRDDIHQENFEITYKDKHRGREVAKIMSEKLSANALGGTFDADKQTYMDFNKRMEVVKMIRANSDYFAAGNGREIKEAILAQLPKNEESFVEQLFEKTGADRAIWGLNKGTKIEAIKHWLDRARVEGEFD